MSAQAFTLDSAKRAYISPDGRPCARVTDILRTCGLYPEYPGGNFYKDRGTALHTACLYLAQNKLVVDTSDGLRFPGTDTWFWEPLRRWAQFITDFGVEIIGAERTVGNPVVGAAGSLDYDVLMNYHGTRRPAIIDIKSGEAPDCVAIQLAAYVDLGGYSRTTLRVSVPLARSHRPKIWTDLNDFAIWTSCLNVYNYRKQHNLLKEK